jgi:hypothetical protein
LFNHHNSQSLHNLYQIFKPRGRGIYAGNAKDIYNGNQTV